MTTGRRRPAGPKPAAPARPLKEGFEGRAAGLVGSEGQGQLTKNTKKLTGDLAGQATRSCPGWKMSVSY